MQTFVQFRTRLGQSILRDDLAPNYGEFINEAIREIENRHSFKEMKTVTYVTIAPGVPSVGGNLIPNGLVWGPAVSFGVAVGAKYYFNQGPDGAKLSADGTTVFLSVSGFFTATATTYYLIGGTGGQPVTSAVISTSLDQVAVLPPDFKELQPRTSIHYVADDGSYIPAEVVFEYQQLFRIWAFGGTPITTWPPRVFFEQRGASNVLGIVEPLLLNFNFKVQYYRYLPDLVADGDVSPLAVYPKLILAKARAIAFTEINDAQAAASAEQEFEKKLKEAIKQDAYSMVHGMDLHM